MPADKGTCLRCECAVFWPRLADRTCLLGGKPCVAREGPLGWGQGMIFSSQAPLTSTSFSLRGAGTASVVSISNGARPLNPSRQVSILIASAACAPARSHPQAARRRAEQVPSGCDPEDAHRIGVSTTSFTIGFTVASRKRAPAPRYADPCSSLRRATPALRPLFRGTS
jgi:hypothetical protein